MDTAADGMCCSVQTALIAAKSLHASQLQLCQTPMLKFPVAGHSRPRKAVIGTQSITKPQADVELRSPFKNAMSPPRCFCFFCLTSRICS